MIIIIALSRHQTPGRRSWTLYSPPDFPVKFVAGQQVQGKCNYANQIKVGKMLEEPWRTQERNGRLHRRGSGVPVLVEANLKVPSWREGETFTYN